MILTNVADLPEEFVEVVKTLIVEPDGMLHVTSLIDAPRIRLLKERHWGELKIDVRDRFWSVMGQLGHILMQRTAPEGALNEFGMKQEVDGVIVSGRADRCHNGIIKDFKFTSVWTAMFGSRDKAWEQQTNVYAWLARKGGMYVEGLQIILGYYDWKKVKAMSESDYIQVPCQVKYPTMWSEERQEQYVRERVAIHKAAEALPDNQLPTCNDEELWREPTKYAVMKDGRKSAVKLCDTEDEAVTKVCELGAPPHYVQERAGGCNRCDKGYCDVRDFCNVYRDRCTESA